MRKAVIDLDWLNAEIEENMGHTGYEAALISVRSKCEPVEQPKEKLELPNYCVVKNKEYCFLSGKCKECSTPKPLPKYCKVKDKEYCFLHDQCQECTDNNNIK